MTTEAEDDESNEGQDWGSVARWGARVILRWW